MRPLWPDLAVIRERMLGAPASEETAAEHDEPVVDAEALPMPAFVAEQIQRLDEVKYGVRAPAVGDVVLISKAGHAPIAVCLEASISRNADGARWRGWMVAAETDYATDKDVLLEESDGPCDPLAGMVETWNPLELIVPDAVRVLAHLSEYRMSIIGEVARESHADTPEPPRPGFITNRETASGRLVLTGTPLGKANDPRAEYQKIFRACAGAYGSVSQPAIAPVAKVASQQQERGGFLAGLSDWLMGHRLAAGATAVALLCVALLPQFANQSTTLSTSPGPIAKVEPKESHMAETGAARREIVASDEFLSDSKLMVPARRGDVASVSTAAGSSGPEVLVYQVKLKPDATISEAKDLLKRHALSFVKFDESTRLLEFAVQPGLVTSELESALYKSGLFIEHPQK
jgi:hypothetical protein